MFTMDENYVSAKFSMIARGRGAPAPEATGPGKPMPVFTMGDFDNSRHDEELFINHLAGKDSGDALSIFLGFQSQLKLHGLRDMTEKEFRAGFLNDYS